MVLKRAVLIRTLSHSKPPIILNILALHIKGDFKPTIEGECYNKG